MCDSIDFVCQLISDSSELVVNWSEIQMSWLSIDLRFKWFGCQMIWGSSELVVNWCVIQIILSNEAFLRDFLQNWSFEAQKRSFSARLPSKTKLWRSKTKLFCETSFKIEALKIKNEAFVRDFLQKWSFEAQKWSISARLPSKMTLWSSKTKLFCETSFKNEALKLKNEAFLRDFLQKWSFEAQKRSISARLPSKMKLWSSKTKHFCETSFKNDMSTLSRGIRSPVTATRNDPCKVTLPWHEICYTLPRFQRRRLKTSTSQSTKSLRLPCEMHHFGASSNPHHACQRFCNPHELLRLPRIWNASKSLRLPRETHFERQKTSRDRQFLTILTSKPLSRAGVVQILSMSTSKRAPGMPVFNDFDFQIALARRRGANFVEINFQKCSGPASF